MNKPVITISREYGSGGHAIGKRLSALLDVPFYDREIVELTAAKGDLDAESLAEMEEQSRLPLRFAFGAAADENDRLFLQQSRTIIELAKSPCVIVGRCADFVLRDHPGRLSFFLYSGLKQRTAHAGGYASLRNGNDPARVVAKMDRRRAAYYKYHTGQDWGAPANYHLCVDTGVLGPQTADALAAFVRLYQNGEGGANA